MTVGKTPGRSLARAHLSRLIELFGTDGWLRVNTAPEPDPAGWAPALDSDGGEPEEDE
ncbi:MULTISPECIES: hypothetical protein [unclassified Streptomyces]|uniref:hypothetical protein n=1 Tax=unclassified Streptomyces TaxID=2593676 RepID=UPI000A75CF38|nr:MULTISPECIES: hypothetical protein [unclassified Streptomyces]